MSKLVSPVNYQTSIKDAHDLDSAALGTVTRQAGLDGGRSYRADTGLITLTSTNASDILYLSNDNTTKDVLIEELKSYIYNSDGDTADFTFVKNPTGFSSDKALALANSLKTVINAHFADSGSLSSAITLANSLKTNMNNHYADSGAQSTAITLANSLKTVLNAHYSDFGALTSSITLCNSLKTNINNHFGDTGALSSAQTLANSLKTNINNHFGDSGAQSSAITLANSLKTVINAHYADEGLTSAVALANSLKTTLNNHYGVADAIIVANAAKATLNAHYNDCDLTPAITRANALKAIYNAHVADATEHPNGADSTNVIAASDATNLATLITLVTEMVGAATTSYHQHDDDAELGAGWSYHEAQESSDHTLADNTAPTDLSECITRINDFRAKYNAHDADSQAHLLGGQHAASIATYPDLVETYEHTACQANVSAADATDYSSLITLVTALLSSYDTHDADAELGAAWVYHDAQEGGDASLASAAAPTTLSECITRLNDLVTKFNTHEGDATAHENGDSGDMTGEAGESHADWYAAVTTTNASNYATLVTLTDAMLTSYDGHDADAELGGGWTYHDAQEASDHSLTSAAGCTSLSDAMDKLNDLKAKLNAHDADASAHPNDNGNQQEATADASGEHLAADTTVSTANASNLATLITLIGALLTSYDTHDNDAEGGSPTYHIAQEGGDASLASAAAPTTLDECITRVNDLKSKYNTHDADSTAHDVGSQHQESNSDAAGEHLTAQATISAAAASNLATLITLLTAEMASYVIHDDDAIAGTPTYHILQGTERALASEVAPTTLDECITRVNDLKAKWNLHDADATAHLAGSGYQEANSDAAGEHLTAQATVSAANASNLATLQTLTDALLTAYDSHDNDAEGGTPTYHILQESGDASLTSAAATTGLSDAMDKLNDLKAKYNIHDADATAHLQGSQYQESNSDAAGEHLTQDTTVSAAAASNLATLKTLTDALITSYDSHDNDAENASPTVHILQEGSDHSLASAAAASTLDDCVSRLNDLKTKLNAHDADATAHDAGSQHQESTASASGEHLTAQATLSAANASDLGTLVTLITAQLTSYATHNTDAKNATPTYHIVQDAGGNDLASAAAPTTLDECMTRVNDLKAKWNLHDAETGSHITGSGYQESNADAGGEHLTAQASVSAANATNQATLITLTTALLSAYDTHDNDAEQATPTYHALTEAADASLASAVAPTTFIECVTRLNDLKAKYNTHDADATAHQTGSDHQESTADAVGTEITPINLNFASDNTAGVSVVSGDEADNLTGGTDFYTEYDVAEGTSFTYPDQIQLGPGDTLGIQVNPDAVTTSYVVKVTLRFSEIDNES